MGDYSKFLFDRSFDDLDPRPDAEYEDDELDGEEEEPEEEEPAPVFSEEELEEARATAFAEGRSAGAEEALAGLESRTAAAMERLAGEIGDLRARQDEATAEVERTAVMLATALVRKMFPVLSRKGALAEVEAVVGDALANLIDEPRLVIRVEPALAEAIQERVEREIAAGHVDGKVLVRADEDMEPGDCRIEWENGGTERRAAALWQDMEDIVARNIGASDEERDRMRGEDTATASAAAGGH